MSSDFKRNNDLAVVYCRVSSDKQAEEDKTALDNQERRGKAKAAELGLTVLYVVRHAESAWVLDDRSMFQGILADAKARKFGVLIVDRANRFSRSEDIGDPVLVERTLKDRGVSLVFSDKDYSNDLTGQLTRIIDYYVAGKDQADRRKLTREGKADRATKGKHPLPGRRAPYGFVWAPTENG